jgi:DNA polymerase III sliding clamp (beta) subunit (PCNA family)
LKGKEFMATQIKERVTSAMEFEVPQRSLKEALGIVRNAASDTGLPVLRMIHVKAVIANGKQAVRLRATNLEIDVTTWVQASVKVAGEICLPAALFDSFVSLVPGDQDISFKLNTENFHCSLATAPKRKETVLFGIAGDEFPAEAKMVLSHTVELSAPKLRAAINQVVYAVDSDPVKALSDVRFKIKPGTIELAACDSFQLGIKTVSVDSGSERADSVTSLPGRSMAAVEKMLPNDEDVMVEVGPSSNGSKLIFRYGVNTISCVLSNRKFPSFEPIIGKYKNWKLQVTISAREFKEAMRSAEPYAKVGGQGAMLITFEGYHMKLFALSEEQAEYSEWVLTKKIDGDTKDVIIYTNIKMISKAVQLVQTENLILESSGYGTPVFIRPLDEDGNIVTDQTHMVMPMFNKRLINESKAA